MQAQLCVRWLYVHVLSTKPHRKEFKIVYANLLNAGPSEKPITRPWMIESPEARNFYMYALRYHTQTQVYVRSLYAHILSTKQEGKLIKPL